MADHSRHASPATQVVQLALAQPPISALLALSGIFTSRLVCQAARLDTTLKAMSIPVRHAMLVAVLALGRPRRNARPVVAIHICSQEAVFLVVPLGFLPRLPPIHVPAAAFALLAHIPLADVMACSILSVPVGRHAPLVPTKQLHLHQLPTEFALRALPHVGLDWSLSEHVRKPPILCASHVKLTSTN